MKAEISQMPFIFVVTANRDRALTLQNKGIPGGKSIHIPFSEVDEDMAKKLHNGDVVPLSRAIDEVVSIAEHKATHDWTYTGGAQGAIDQLSRVGKNKSDAEGFSSVARIFSDTMRIVYTDSGVQVFNKIPNNDIYRVADIMSGKKVAILTALSRISAPVNEMTYQLKTMVALTEFWFKPFTWEEYVAVAKEKTMGTLRSISGAIPFEDNPLVNKDKQFHVVVYEKDKPKKTLLRGNTWSLFSPIQSVHAAYPEIVAPLLRT